MKRLVRDGLVVWAANEESAAALQYAGWVELPPRPQPPTPVTPAQRRGQVQARQAVSPA